MAEWTGLINITAPKYLKGAEDETVRGRLLLAMLKQRGRLMFNQGGGQTCTWDVEMAEHTLHGGGDALQYNFTRLDAYRQLTENWRENYITDVLSEREKLINSGTEAIINRYDTTADKIKQSLKNQFPKQLFYDGNLAANSTFFSGLETFLGAGTVAVGDRIAMPSDTYGGRSTALQAEGGTWSDTLGAAQPNSTLSTDWPDGNGTPEYDYLAPVLMNDASTAWGTDSTAWVDNCELCIQQMKIWLTRKGGEDGTPTLFLFDSTKYFGLINKLQSLRRLVLPHKEATDLGFGDTINEAGTAIKHDFDVPAQTGYALNVNKMQIKFLTPEMYVARGPEYDIRENAYLWRLGVYGQATFSPKYHGKLYPYASS
jgi:hypothetical protein